MKQDEDMDGISALQRQMSISPGPDSEGIEDEEIML